MFDDSSRSSSEKEENSGSNTNKKNKSSETVNKTHNFNNDASKVCKEKSYEVINNDCSQPDNKESRTDSKCQKQDHFNGGPALQSTPYFLR